MHKGKEYIKPGITHSPYVPSVTNTIVIGEGVHTDESDQTIIEGMDDITKEQLDRLRAMITEAVRIEARNQNKSLEDRIQASLLNLELDIPDMLKLRIVEDIIDLTEQKIRKKWIIS